MPKLRLNAWPHNDGLYSSPTVSVRVGEVVEVPEDVAAKLTVDFKGYFEVVPGRRMAVADALEAAGLSDRLIGKLEKAGMLGPQILKATSEDLVQIKGIGASSAEKVLEAVAVLK